MIYKSYAISQSINGTVLVFLARNRANAVVFRESSEKKLKQAIDDSLEQKEKERVKVIEEKKAIIKKARKRDLFQSKDQYAQERQKAEKAEKELVSLPPIETKSKKGSFWDRLK